MVLRVIVLKVWEIKVRLVLASKPSFEDNDMPIAVEMSTDTVLPSNVQVAMQDAVLSEWRTRLDRKNGKVGWDLVPMLEWVESHYVELLSVLPVYVNRFIAVNDQGSNEWRFTILEPTAPTKKVEEEVEWTEEQIQNEIARKRRELEAQQKAEQERLEWAAERRRLSELEGPKPRQMSKKEIDDMKAAKRGQGERTAKTGPRRRKFNADAAEDS